MKQDLTVSFTAENLKGIYANFKQHKFGYLFENLLKQIAKKLKIDYYNLWSGFDKDGLNKLENDDDVHTAFIVSLNNEMAILDEIYFVGFEKQELDTILNILVKKLVKPHFSEIDFLYFDSSLIYTEGASQVNEEDLFRDVQIEIEDYILEKTQNNNY